MRIEPVDSRAKRETFIRLPDRLYAGHPGYVAPLHADRRKTLDPRKNPYFRHAEARLWLAYRGDRAVGRISAQVDRLYLERHRDATGHFGFLDAEDDAEAFEGLTGAAEQWLRAQDLRRALGPFSLSINDECGLLIEGFDQRPTVMMGFNLPYADTRLRAQGYGKAKDLLAYDLDIHTDVTAKADRVVVKAADNPRVKLRQLDMGRYKEDLTTILDIFNDAWSENWGFVPMTPEEIDAAAKAMRPLIRRELVLIAEFDGEPVCTMVTLPNLYEVIGDLQGRLLPFGWAKLLWRLRTHRFRTARVFLLGLRKQLRRSAIGTAIMFKVFGGFREAMRGLGIRKAELSWILEDNVAMRGVLEGVGGQVYKRYRIYEKALV